MDSIRLHSSANYSFDMQKAFQMEDEAEGDKKEEPSMNQMNSTDNLICRICLSEEEMPEHELISPCKCTGSMSHIGISCIKEWLTGKRHCKET